MKINVILITLFSSMMLADPAGQVKDRNSVIYGTVYDSNKKPVAAAEIFVDGKSTGRFSGNKGKFKIKIKHPASIVAALSPDQGYAEAEITEQQGIELILDKAIRNIPDNISGNGEGKNSTRGGSVKMNTYTDIYQMIRNEVPGVLVSGRNIVVQGPNSFFGSAQPLFIVNGVRVINIDYINPVEVKSIRLLKGSGANIYGNEGANGVIVIELHGTTNKNVTKK